MEGPPSRCRTPAATLVKGVIMILIRQPYPRPSVRLIFGLENTGPVDSGLDQARFAHGGRVLQSRFGVRSHLDDSVAWLWGGHRPCCAVVARAGLRHRRPFQPRAGLTQRRTKPNPCRSMNPDSCQLPRATGDAQPNHGEYLILKSQDHDCGAERPQSPCRRPALRRDTPEHPQPSAYDQGFKSLAS